MNMNLPDWMFVQNEYVPQKDKDGFLTKTILNFLRLFRHFHVEKNEYVTQIRAGFRTILVIGLIILSAISKNMFFCGCVAAGFLLFLSFVKIEVIKRVLSTAFAAAFFTMLIMLPSFLLYKSIAFVTISIKVFISTGMLSLFALITPWNKITSALSFIRIPSFIIFILDLTIHYILILGNIAYEMLFALNLRSVGKNKSKEKSFSGILGTVFLKSITYAEETQQAMECRLYNGISHQQKAKINIKDFIPIIILILYIILFVYVA